MATNLTNLQYMYENITADLVAFYENAVLLPNQSLIQSIYSIEGAVGNQMSIPTQNSFTPGASGLAEEADIIAANTSNLVTSQVLLSVNKRGSGTYVTAESLEDIGVTTVTNNVVNQLSRSIALATDKAGFNVMLSGAEAALTDLANINVTTYGPGNVALGSADVGVVFSPEAMAYAVKRSPSVLMNHDVVLDRHEVVATVRNGFAQVRPTFIKAIATSADAAEANATLKADLDVVSQAVAGLRLANAPTDASGFLMACITPVQELHIASQLNSVTQGMVGDLSVIGNQALLSGMIGQAVGCRFYRTNNLPTVTTI